MMAFSETPVRTRDLEGAGTAWHAQNGVGIEDASTVHRARFYG